MNGSSLDEAPFKMSDLKTAENVQEGKIGQQESSSESHDSLSQLEELETAEKDEELYKNAKPKKTFKIADLTTGKEGQVTLHLQTMYPIYKNM
jgi:hypothetical protein